MHTVKAAEPNRPRLEGLACINSKKWDKGVRVDYLNEN